MTPKEYAKLKDRLYKTISYLEYVIKSAQEEAKKCKFPESVRKAQIDDLIAGAIIWQKEDNPHWDIIEEVYGNKYCADDGCIYDIENAYIEIGGETVDGK